MQQRPHGQGPEGQGSTIIGMISWQREDNTWGHQHMLFCFNPVFANEWAQCSGTVTIDAQMAAAVHAQISFGYRESWATFDVDYDDMFFKVLA